MIERDYIMRMIQMLVQALMKMLSFKEKKDYPRALNEIHNASKSLIGVDLDVIRRLSDIQMIELLSLVKEFGSLRCYFAGRLLKEESEILELKGERAESTDARTKALSLLLEAAIEKGAPLDSDHASAIDGVAGKVNHADLPVHIHKKMFRYYDLIGQFRKADEALFVILKMEPSFIAVGVRYNEKLNEKSDRELSEGNFSRKEIETGLLDLRQRE